jgi:probable phosphomutase (TIGR03848 family)
MDEQGHPACVCYGRGAEVPLSTVLLIRHGHCDPVGKCIAGRSPGVHLDAAGRREARVLTEALVRLRVVAVYSSPLERARETASPLAERLGLTVAVSPGLEELNYGDWTGRSLESLAEDAHWQRFNRERAGTRIPGGETMGEVVARASHAVDQMRARHAEGVVAAVTHGDVIRALLASWAGMPLDHMLRLEIAPGSASAVRFSPDPQLLVVNWLPELDIAL